MEDINLMIPGPVQLDYSVLSQMSAPMVAHYGEEWTRFYNEVVRKLKIVMGTQEDVFIMTGSGHMGLEAAIASTLREEDEILVCINGFFGHRLIEIVQSYVSKVHTIKVDWGKAITPTVIEEILQRKKEVKLVIVVHGETSTGVVNPIKEIAQVCRRYDVLLMIDAVSSIGAMPFKMDEWSMDLCITASQKGLGAPPGLAIVAVSDRAWQAIKTPEISCKGWCLNLFKWKEYSIKGKDWQPYFITMAINNVRALDMSLNNIIEEGLNRRFERHEKVAKAFRMGIRNMGLSVLANESVASSAVTVVKMPTGISSKNLISFLRKEYNIAITNGLDSFKDKAIRVGHMGSGAHPYRILPVLFGIETFLRCHSDKKIPLGASLIGFT